MSIAAQTPSTMTGAIAYIGADYNVYSITFSSETVQPLTTDGSDNRRYEWPIWSRDGQLAYFCCSPPFSDDIGIEVFLSENGTEAGELLYENNQEILTYAYWSPRNCQGDCGGLAILSSVLTASQFQVRILQPDNDEPLDLGQGAPFYFSWSPDGRRLVTHRNNRLYEVFSLDTETLIQLSQRPGITQSPAWSPVDDRLLLAIANPDDNTTSVVIVTEDEAFELVSGIEGLVSFNWSSDGNYVAFRDFSTEGYGQLTVVDAVTSERVAFTPGEQVIAFFWAPDAQSIAYITLEDANGSFNARSPVSSNVSMQQESIRLHWSTLSLEDGSSHRHTSFFPTQEMAYLLTYFDQFGQSHRVWSPDSNYIVFSEITPENKSVVSVLDVSRTDSVPFLISDGYIGIWSYE